MIDPEKFFHELGRTQKLGPEYELQPEFYSWMELRRQKNYHIFLNLISTKYEMYNNALEKFISFVQQDWQGIIPTREELEVIELVAKGKEPRPDWDKRLYLQIDAQDFLDYLNESA